MIDGRKGALAYLDSNVFIDFVQGEPDLAQRARAVLSSLRQHEGVFATSDLTLAEVLAGPDVSAPERRLFMNLIVWNPAVTLVPVSRDILIETADLRKFTRHKLPDAIVVTALRQKCQFIVSRDENMKKLPANIISRLDPNEAVKVLQEAWNGR